MLLLLYAYLFKHIAGRITGKCCLLASASIRIGNIWRVATEAANLTCAPKPLRSLCKHPPITSRNIFYLNSTNNLTSTIQVMHTWLQLSDKPVARMLTNSSPFSQHFVAL